MEFGDQAPRQLRLLSRLHFLQLQGYVMAFQAIKVENILYLSSRYCFLLEI